MKTRQTAIRLGLAFAILLTIVMTIGWLGLSRMNQTNANLEDTVGQRWATVRLAQQALEYSNLNSRITMEILLVEDPEQIKAKLTARAENTRRISELLDKIEAQSESGDESKLIAAIRRTRKPYVDGYQRAVHLLVDGENRDAAKAFMVQQVTPAMVTYHAAWQELVRFEVDQIDVAATRSQGQFVSTRHKVSLAILLAAVLTGAIAIYVTYRMTREVTAHNQNLLSANQKLASEAAERERAEKELRKSEEQTRLLLDSTAEAIYAIDLEGKCTLCNSACASMTGHDSPADLLGRNMHEALHHTRADGTPYPVSDCKIFLSFRQGSDSHVDDEVLWRKDGTCFPAEYWSYPIHSGNKVIGSVVTFLDITQRKQTQEALRRSEEKFRRLSEANIVGVMTGNLEGDLPEANTAFLEMTGYCQQDIESGMRWDRMVLKEDMPFWQEVGNELQESGTWAPHEVTLLRKDGSRVRVLMGLAMVNKAKGETIGFAFDLTARKRAEEALLRANQNMSTLIEASPVAMVAIGPGGVVQSWNPAAERLFGWHEEEALGRVLPTVPANGQAEFHERLERGLKGEDMPPTEIQRVRKDGSLVEISTSTASLRDAQGNVTGIIAVMVDITERKRADEELQKARVAAEAANRAKSEFLANMSHEIRTPMNGIIGMTELALDTELTREQQEYLGMVKSSADSLLTVINDILDFSKIEAGKLELDPIEFNIRNSVDDTAKILALKAHQKGLELITDVEPFVPEILVGDPVRLRQILFNLLGNAVKFTERGEVILRVTAEENTEGGVRVHFSIKDTGIGIPKGRQQVIFEAFTQADSSMTRVYGGTGLGLTITARLIKLMGGRIWVESDLGRGSTFHFTGNFGIGKAPMATAAMGETADLAGLAVMVVDDNETNRRILRQTLLNWQMRPTMAQGGREALAILEHAQRSGKPFPLVISDMQMPEMDGFELAERIKENPALTGATIMMLTSAGQRGDGARCRELGVKAYLIKPIKQSELRDAILAAISRGDEQKGRDALVTRHSLRENHRVLRVLLAEDNKVNQVFAKRLLEQRGHTVVVANNGLEALARLETATFDMVLMDVQMPEMDGFEATRAIREKEQSSGDHHLPILALTAHAMTGDQERCLAAGMDGYLSKPLHTAELFAAIDRLTPAVTEFNSQPEYSGKGTVH
ncbi:MAG TPA: PAS domain S-box protein [Candidatus Angelobacter sp.]|nr:PAS domain S-box protein [Candidatus Angelobacter sp.]